MRLSATVADRAEALRAADLAGWEALADAAMRPFGLPVWGLAAWHEARLGRAELRVVVVRDGDEVVAVAPMFRQLGPLGLVELRLLGAGISHRLGILCRPGRESEAAPVVAAAVRDGVHSFVWEGVDAQDRWPELLAPHVRGALGAAQRVDNRMVAPVATLPAGDFDAWLATRSGNARSELRRNLRKLEQQGGAIRLAGADSADRDVDALARLHEARWEGRGGSAALDAQRLAMLRRAVRDGAASGRIRLWMVDLGGEPIGAALFACAGGALAYWGGGMAPEHERLRPGQLAIVGALRDALERGEREIDFGGGEARYKRRLGDEDRPIVWRTTLVRGVRHPLTRAQLAPKHLRWAVRDAVRRLPPERRERVKRLLGRG